MGAISFFITSFVCLSQFGEIRCSVKSKASPAVHDLLAINSVKKATNLVSHTILKYFDLPSEMLKEKLSKLSTNKFVKKVLNSKINGGGLGLIELIESRGLLYCFANYSDVKTIKGLRGGIKEYALQHNYIEKYPKIYEFIVALPKLRKLSEKIEPVGKILLSAYLGEKLDELYTTRTIINLGDDDRKLLNKWQEKMYGKLFYSQLGDPTFENQADLMKILRNLQYRPINFGEPGSAPLNFLLIIPLALNKSHLERGRYLLKIPFFIIKEVSSQ